MADKEVKQTSVLVSKLSKLQAPQKKWGEEVKVITSRVWIPSSFKWLNYLHGYDKKLNQDLLKNFTISFKTYFKDMNVKVQKDLKSGRMSLYDIPRVNNLQEMICK